MQKWWVVFIKQHSHEPLKYLKWKLFQDDSNPLWPKPCLVISLSLQSKLKFLLSIMRSFKELFITNKMLIFHNYSTENHFQKIWTIALGISFVTPFWLQCEEFNYELHIWNQSAMPLKDKLFVNNVNRYSRK